MEDEKSNEIKNQNRTINEQTKIEQIINHIFNNKGFDIKKAENFESEIIFNYEYHLEFVKKMMRGLPGSYSGIDSGLPWFSYWVLNIFEICNMNKYELSYEMKMKFVNYLKELQHEDGGFCGYSKGEPHIVSNYAAVMAVINIGLKEAYEIIDRNKMKNFLKRMKNNRNIAVIDNNNPIEKLSNSRPP
jgi:protein farnesyltransferase subunit beta